MKAYTVFKKYIWMINTIYRAGKISLADLNAKWRHTDMSGGVDMHRNTFMRHRNAIEDMFGVNIVCNGYNEYYIANARVLSENSIQNWMLSTLSVSNVVSESQSINDRILLERIPSQGMDLETLLEAMKRNVCVRIVHQKYETDTPKPRLIEPYCVRMFKLRWYVLGRLHEERASEKDNGFRHFSLDRILETEKTDIPFVMDPHFSAEEYYGQSFGVFVDEHKEPERVVLRATKYERFYLHDLPAHPSQKMIRQGDDYADFEYYIRPTDDFCNYIMGRGSYLKVLSPQWLVDHIKDMLTATLGQYNS